MYQDCLKIAKDNILIGNGGNAWKQLQTTVQEFPYETKETHSYSLELLISYGIIGVIAYLSVVIYLAILIIKKCKENPETRKNKLALSIGLFILLLHSLTFDFEMSFMLIQILAYVCIAITIYDENENTIEHKIYKYIDYIVLAFLAIMLTIPIRGCISEYILKNNLDKHNLATYKKTYYYESLKENNKTDKTGKSDRISDIQNYINKEPYYMQTEIFEMYFDEIYKNINSLDNEELEKYIDFGINKLNTIKFKTPMYAQQVINRTKMIVYEITKYKLVISSKKTDDEEKIQIINGCIQKLKDIVIKEYETNILNLRDTQKNGFDEQQQKKMEETYLSFVKQAK